MNVLQEIKILIARILNTLRKDQLNFIGLPHQVHILANIDLSLFNSLGIRGIILDLDNTIISEDDQYLSPNFEDWLHQAKLLGIKLFFLSNGKRNYRVEYWSNRFGIPAINPAKKPFPPAFRRAMQHMKLLPHQVLVIGDSRHTDVLGAWWVGCRSIQVASLPHPPRWWEKLLGQWVQNPFPKELELWDFQALTHYGKY